MDLGSAATPVAPRNSATGLAVVQFAPAGVAAGAAGSAAALARSRPVSRRGRAVVPAELAFGPFRGRDAVASGLLTRRQLAGPAWRRMFPDIYVAADVLLDHAARCAAAALWLGSRGVLSGRSAACLWQAGEPHPDSPIEVTVPRQVRVAPRDGLVVVRSALERSDVALAAGLPVTTPARTGFDLARRRSLVQAVIEVDALLHTGLVTIDQVRCYAADHPAWPGATRLGSALALADAGAASPMESRTRLLLAAGGLPRPETQLEVYSNGCFIARVDLGYREQRVAVEYEGDHHRSRCEYQRDLRRLNALQAAGWGVLRFGSVDIFRRPRHVVAAVHAVLRDRSGADVGLGAARQFAGA